MSNPRVVATLVCVPVLPAAPAEVRTLPTLTVDSRGELLLGDDGAVRYRRRHLQPLPADTRAGVLVPESPSFRHGCAVLV